MGLQRSRGREKLLCPMAAKRWAILLAAGSVCLMLAMAAVNYIVDPYSYFHSSAADGGVYYIPGKTYNLRMYQYHYFKEHHKEYDGVILGGSKGMYISEEHLYSLTGDTYYNLAANYGNFHDYLSWVRWIAQNTDIKRIFLNLSSLEVDFYTVEEREADETGYCYQPAALDTDKNKLTEFVQYLYKGGIRDSLEFLKQKTDGTLPFLPLGKSKENALYGGIYTAVQDRKRDPYATAVYINEDLADLLQNAADGIHNDMPAMAHNLEAAKEIKAICEDAGIRLQVVLASTYISQYLSYESPQYWEYLKALADITDYWDFSFANRYNRNPYNFLDARHAHADTLSRMADQIYGKIQLEDFGVYVTADNADAHMKEREDRFYSLMREYQETGSVQLGTAFDKSYLMDDLLYPTISNTESLQEPGILLKDCLHLEQHFYAGFDHLQGVGIFLEGLPEEKNERGILHMEIYDDTAKHRTISRDIDIQNGINGVEQIIQFDNLGLTEGHWYSIILSYQSKTQDDETRFVYVNGDASGQICLDVDGGTVPYEIKMNIYRLQTRTSCLIGSAKLKTDQMRGEGEGKTPCISKTTPYVQTFQAACSMLSYIRLRMPGQEAGPKEDTDRTIFFELQDPQGNTLAMKTVSEQLLQTSSVYDLVMDQDIWFQKGNIYKLVIYADTDAGHGLELPTHGEDQADGSILYINGKNTGASLCYCIYGLEEGQPGQEE